MLTHVITIRYQLSQPVILKLNHSSSEQVKNSNHKQIQTSFPVNEESGQMIISGPHLSSV